MNVKIYIDINSGYLLMHLDNYFTKCENNKTVEGKWGGGGGGSLPRN